MVAGAGCGELAGMQCCAGLLHREGGTAWKAARQVEPVLLKLNETPRWLSVSIEIAADVCRWSLLPAAAAPTAWPFAHVAD